MERALQMIAVRYPSKCFARSSIGRIAIKRIGAADERSAIVLRTKRLDPKRSLGSARRRLRAGGFAIPAHRVAQAVIDSLGIQPLDSLNAS